MSIEFGPWAMTECSTCGEIFRVTRGGGRSFDSEGDVICEACSLFAEGRDSRTDEILALQAEIEEWQDATGLMRGGDPGGVTPDDLRRELDFWKARSLK